MRIANPNSPPIAAPIVSPFFDGEGEVLHVAGWVETDANADAATVAVVVTVVVIVSVLVSLMGVVEPDVRL